jgi:hypothetical protein
MTTMQKVPGRTYCMKEPCTADDEVSAVALAFLCYNILTYRHMVTARFFLDRRLAC